MFKLDFPTDEKLQSFINEFEAEYGTFLSIDDHFSQRDFVTIFFKAIIKFFENFPEEGYRPLPFYKTDGSEFQNASLVQSRLGEDGFPYIVVSVYRDDGSWVFNGYVNYDRLIGYFGAVSYKYLRAAERVDKKITDEQFKERLLNTTLEVMMIAIRRLPKWMEIMLDSLDSKIELIWAKQLYQEMRAENSLGGFDFPRLDLNVERQNAIRAVNRKIREFLNDDTGFDTYMLNLKKKTLALAFKQIYSHWETIEKLQVAGKAWRRYVRAGDMNDVPEDLIEAFMSGARIGDIAVEHAARRARLLNTGKLTKRNAELRMKGVHCSGYSRSKLFSLKSEGEKLIAQEAKSAAESTVRKREVDSHLLESPPSAST